MSDRLIIDDENDLIRSNNLLIKMVLPTKGTINFNFFGNSFYGDVIFHENGANVTNLNTCFYDLNEFRRSMCENIDIDLSILKFLNLTQISLKF